jgi:dTDP-4-dehydrorhamnose reductase
LNQTVGSTLLLTGASGYLGHYLTAAAAEIADLRIVTLGRRNSDVAFDLAAANAPEPLRAIASFFERDPNCRLLHTAALSSIAACRQSPDLADRINHQATRALATLAGSSMVLVSTDQVFGGAGAPFESTDPARPHSEYGWSKARAEAAALHQGATVARLPLLFGRSFDGQRGASDMLRRAHGRLELYHNEFRTPLHVADAASLLLELVADPRAGGVHHLTHGERLSRLELGQRLLTSCPDMPPLDLVAATSSAVDRPRDVSLVPTLRPRRPLAEALASC